MRSGCGCSAAALREQRLKGVLDALQKLRKSQMAWTQVPIDRFLLQAKLSRKPGQELINDGTLEMFGYGLQI